MKLQPEPQDPNDPINHPEHYTASAIEVIDAIEAWNLNFHLGNVIKYITRCDRKGSPIEDLKKARWYLDREIQKREL
jgi:plasmid replication initiation protein